MTSSGKCSSAERKLQFNQRGPAGLPGAPGASGRSALDSLRSGETIHGVWALSGSSDAYTGITFPIPTVLPVDSAHVVVVGNDDQTGDGCTRASPPVAARGFVCVYIHSAAGTSTAAGLGALAIAPDDTHASDVNDGSDYGFGIRVSGSATFYANGTWAYTAP